MNRSINAMRLAAAERRDQMVPEDIRRQTLVEAQASGVTNTDFIRAHILTVASEKSGVMNICGDDEQNDY